MSETTPTKRFFCLWSGYLQEGQVDATQKKKKKAKNSWYARAIINHFIATTPKFCIKYFYNHPLCELLLVCLCFANMRGAYITNSIPLSFVIHVYNIW